MSMANIGHWLFAFVLLLNSLGGTLQAQSDVKIMSPRIGLDGHFRVGFWAPLEFQVTAGGKPDRQLTPRLITVDPDGQGVITELPEFSIGDEIHTVNGLIRSGKLEAPITIELLEQGRVVAQQTLRVDHKGRFRCWKQQAKLWILDGEQPGFQAASELLATVEPQGIYVAGLADLAGDLADPTTFEPVSLIVLNASTELPEPVAQAIGVWVRRGGKLVISIGEDVATLNEGPLAAWLPILPTETTEIRNLSGLNLLVAGSSPLRMLGSLTGARFEPSSGRVLASELGVPLVIRAPHGLGSVSMLAVRLDRRPLSDWGARAELAMVLANEPPSWKEGSRTQQSAAASLNPTGVTDLQTQLIQAIDHYDEIQRPSYWVVIGWSALLILLIGPLDYFILHHLVRRPQWTWLTLPVWLTLITCWACWAAMKTNDYPGSSRQIELVDVDLPSGIMRGRAWYNFYSEETRRSRIEVQVSSRFMDSTDPGSVRFLTNGWMSRPESGYRGMYRSGGLESQKASYRTLSEQRGVAGLPVTQWSTGSIGADWEAAINPAELIQTDLRDPGNGRLTGSLTWLAPEELSEWFIAYGNFAYFPRTPRTELQAPMRQGDQFDLRTARSNMLRGVLLGLTYTSIFREDKNKEIANIDRQQYNTMSRDPFPILRTLSFHEVTGGLQYTGLRNETLAAADLSHLIELQQAVLFARIQKPISRFLVDGSERPQAQHDAVVRIFLPVKVELPNLDAPPDPALLERK